MLLMTDIQRFSVHDGPGIRTTFFLKGCLLRCPWCSNPETQERNPEVYFLEEKCLLKKGFSCSFCNAKKIDDIRLHIASKSSLFTPSHVQCPTGALGVYGFDLSVDDFISIAKKDFDYFTSSRGGVTFSGGEPLIQDISPFILAVKEYGIHVALESSMFVPINNLSRVIDLIDLFIIDVKILSHSKCKVLLHGDLDMFLRNVNLLSQTRRDDVLLRFPVVKGYTYTTENLQLLIDFIKKFGFSRLEIFGVHNLGKMKYKSLGKEYQDFNIINKVDLENICDMLYKETRNDIKILY